MGGSMVRKAVELMQRFRDLDNPRFVWRLSFCIQTVTGFPRAFAQCDDRRRCQNVQLRGCL